MENASKALIIAGAILLAILLISLGIMIYTQAQNTVQNSGMNQAAVTSFNNQFIKYEGSIKGTMVKSMIQEVLAVNADSSTNEYSIKVNGKTNPVTSNITNNNTIIYWNIFVNSATSDNSKIIVNYTMETSDLVDKMIATKSPNSNVVKGNLI